MWISNTVHIWLFSRAFEIHRCYQYVFSMWWVTCEISHVTVLNMWKVKCVTCDECHRWKHVRFHMSNYMSFTYFSTCEVPIPHVKWAYYSQVSQMRHVSCRVRNVTWHMSHVTFHVMWHVMSHDMSHVTWDMTHVSHSLVSHWCLTCAWNVCSRRFQICSTDCSTVVIVETKIVELWWATMVTMVSL